MGKKKPVLVVMAAGMGSRYGGMKQIDPVDEYGHIIIDFSIYDAVRAGFEKVVFIIKKEKEELFRERIGARISKKVEECASGWIFWSGRTRKAMGDRACSAELPWRGRRPICGHQCG